MPKPPPTTWSTGPTKRSPPSRPVVVTIRAHLADCYAELGQLDQAVAGMSRAAADCQAVVGPHHSLAVALQQDAATLRDTWVEG
jgi:hypothetical protein